MGIAGRRAMIASETCVDQWSSTLDMCPNEVYYESVARSLHVSFSSIPKVMIFMYIAVDMESGICMVL